MDGRQWVAIAREVAEVLAADAVAREEKGADPVAEVGLLRERGLLTLLVPAEHGGAGADWATGHAVLAEIAAADASIGHVLGYHYIQHWRVGLYDRPDLTAAVARDTVRHGWFWAGVANPRDDALVLSEVEGGYRVDGRKFFATGASVADRLIVSGDLDGRKITFMLDARADGLTYLGDWDNMGQRLSASGGVDFKGVFLPAENVLGALPEPDDPRHQRESLPALAFQLALSRVLAATGRGALRAAAGYTRSTSRAWPASGVERAVDDPHTLATYGILTARLDAADLLVDRALAAFVAADAAGVGLTAQQRGEASVAVSAAKAVTSELTVEITSKVFELTGARATAARHGFDRYWRNARTITLHDPAVYKAAEVGRYVLTGEVPTIGGYS